MTAKAKTRDAERSAYKNFIQKAEEFNRNANRIVRILRMKNIAEYEERLVYKSEAQKIFKDCERFLEFVKSKV